ncbi:AAA family ATPase [Spiroplasma sp. AdecLV25b]|uniref:AAA family ATPase n=1 Tax=Spiroplasma sp. AdecLV25b TaxID=3027162 RepID=UPI0027E0806D|nr:AAA family ATPase [Spiroplasma sp. AdecLV25b]
MLKFSIKEFKSIVKEIDFKIYPKKINFIIGKNGLGKTNVLEAINWFINGSTDNICSQSTNSSYKSTANIILNYNLIDYKVDEITNIISNYSDNKSLSEINKNYIEKTSDSASYNFLYNKNGELTSLAKVIDLMIKSKKDAWLDKRFYKYSQKGYYSLDTDISKESIEKMTDMTSELKEKHINLYEDIKKVENMYKEKPLVIYIKNADLENKTKYQYSIDEFSQKEKNKDFMDLLRFLGDDILSEIKKLTQINSIDENGDKQANQIMKKIDKKANEKLKNLFSEFDIYGYPEIRSVGAKLTIEVKSKEDYEYDDVETEFNSSGYKAFYQLMINLENAKYYVQTKRQKVIILADEPDKNLHPLLQQQLADYLTDFAKNNPNIYLLITTHSPFLLKDLNNIFYITERTNNLNHDGKKEGSTIFTFFEAKMANKSNQIKNLYTLLVASELYSDNNNLFSSLSEKRIVYTNGNMEIDRELKKQFDKLGFTDLVIRPLKLTNNPNKIFSNATIVDYFTETTNINNIIELREKIKKGETILFHKAIEIPNLSTNELEEEIIN